MAKYTYAQTRADYAARWTAMVLTPARLSAIIAAARKIMAGRDRYKAVEAATGVPWAFIGVLHYRESACNFRGVLHNGEKILGTGRKTSLVPKGRGPFGSWEDSARDALAIKGFRPGSPAWSLDRCLYEGERFNGFGYRMRAVPSAYLWSGTNQYAKGKYVADGKWSATTVDKQLGIAPLMRALMDLDPSVTFDGPEPPDVADVEPADGLDYLEIRSVQQRLRDLGYSETGRVDGLCGPRTIAGLSAFQATSGLPVTGALDTTTAAALTTAGPRPVADERANVTAQELARRGDVVVKSTERIRLGSILAMFISIIVGVADGITAALGEPLPGPDGIG